MPLDLDQPFATQASQLTMLALLAVLFVAPLILRAKQFGRGALSCRSYGFPVTTGTGEVHRR